METVAINVGPPASVSTRNPSEQRGLRVIVKDLRYVVSSNTNKGEKVEILKGITAWLEPGQMAAVMGASGSGKTTLLDLLAGRKTTGEIGGLLMFGGAKPSNAFLRRHTGYVEQFDTLVDSLTVREMLLYTAELKRPMKEPLGLKAEAVGDLLEKLALTSCRDVRIGSPLKRGISGGQAKRTNVGIALITNPSVLFLDEPTSGLDSTTANEVMLVVKGIAKDGVTICATIHSPSSFCYALFDRCLVLCSGYTAYFGHPQQDAIHFFTTCCSARQPTVGDNLAEWMMDIITKADREGISKAICDSYEKSDLGVGNTARLASYLVQSGVDGGAAVRSAGSISLIFADGTNSLACCGHHTYVTSPLWSLRVLLQYRTLRNYRNMEYLGPRLADKAIFALIIMLLYLGAGDSFIPRNIPNMCALMYLCIAQPAWGAVSYLPAIMLERGLYVREHNDGLYRPFVYLLFKMVDELTINWVVGLGSCAILFFGVQLQGSYVYFWLNLMMTLSNGVVIAYCLASVCPNLDVANSAVPTMLAIMLFLSGFLIRVPDIPVYLRWISYINLLRYSWAGLMLNQFGDHMDTQFGGVKILHYYGVDAYDKWAILGIIGLFFTFWSVLAWLALTFVRHHRR